MLVDADLRMQSVQKYLGYRHHLGLIDYLQSKAAVEDIITWPGIEKLTIISGDRVMPDSSEIMSSPRMQAIVGELKDRYADRYIIFDAPPILGVADTLAFAPLVDGIIIVVAAGVTTGQRLNEAIELLPKDKIAGFVLNRFKGRHTQYGKVREEYGYGMNPGERVAQLS
jgi:non-specific protein-tyrosine kinase